MTNATQSRILTDPLFGQLKEKVIRYSGLAYYQDKDDALADAVGHRLEACGVDDCSEYFHYLGSGSPEELDQLVGLLTIGETFFFRHRQLFQAVRDVVIPDLLVRRQETRRLRVWSAACSNGPEVYSLSILLRRDLGYRLGGWDWTIRGTDIDYESLGTARLGVYDEWAFRSNPPEFREQCFVLEGSRWSVRPEYRRGVSFEYHNLVEPTGEHPPVYDLILCRNVMIYFTEAIVEQVIGRLHDSLAPGGWLLVGHSETQSRAFRSFRTVNTPGAVLHQKVSDAPFDLALGEDTSVAAVRSCSPPNAKSAAPPAESSVLPEPVELLRSLMDRGDWEGAGKLCAKELDGSRLDASLHYLHAVIVEQFGNTRQAQESLKQAIYLDRRFVLAHYQLGALHQKTGDVEGAKRCFRNAQRILCELDDAAGLKGAEDVTVGELRGLVAARVAAI